MSRQPVRRPFGLVVSGDAVRHVEALRRLLGPVGLVSYDAADRQELLGLIEQGHADAAVVDSPADDREVLATLRIIRRVRPGLPVVLVAREVSRRFLEDALRLAAFSIAHKPLEREELLLQLRRITERFYRDFDNWTGPAGR